MPYATLEDQTLRATARNFAYYLLPGLRAPVDEFLIFAAVQFPPIRETSAIVRPAPRLPA